MSFLGQRTVIPSTSVLVIIVIINGHFVQFSMNPCASKNDSIRNMIMIDIRVEFERTFKFELIVAIAPSCYNYYY